jgi:putative sigma-54 modulation protein
MKVLIRERNVEVTEALRAHVTRRLAFALGRFAERIGRVTVRFSEGGDDRRAVEKLCQIDVGLRSRSVRAEDIDADPFVAVNHAAGRASRSVARALERERGWDAADAQG